ncbi:MAG TPA: ATP-dependent Clp protease ATP-binding subunit [Candidatus Paceibacterota bacterium]|nr:ATP-dependent Clp protease ATP-binding subunit [Candidatus Paceibacterota bacterium]
MPSGTANGLELYFDDPRIRMTTVGRWLTRVVSYVAYFVLVAVALTFLISELRVFFWSGVFIVLFLLDRWVHRGEGDVPISEFPESGRVNIARAFRPDAFAVLGRAADRSAIVRHPFFLEVADRLLEVPDVQEGIERLDVKPKEFREKLRQAIADGASRLEKREDCVAQAALLANEAFKLAIANGQAFVSVHDLFAALANVHDETLDHLFEIFSMNSNDMERALIFGAASSRRRFGRIPVSLGGFTFAVHRTMPHRIMNRAWTSRPTPTLDRYAADLTDRARDMQVGFMIGHDEEYERLVETLGRPSNPNAILVGEAGIGKETILGHLAFMLTKDDVPRALFDKRLVSLDIQGLVAGAPPEELNARLRRIVQEIEIAGNIIIAIPDIHNLVKTSGTAYLSAADALMPIIMNNSFPVVGTTYPKEFKQAIEPRSDFVGAFEVIRVQEVSPEDAEKIITYECLILEKQHDITISFGAIKRAVVLAKKYLHDKFLPSSAEELLKSAVVQAESRGEKVLGPDLVTSIAESKLHMPLHEAEGEESEKLLNLEHIIHTKLVDQEEAVKAVAQALREYRSGLTRKGGPIASFLFVGPTGVGKTELAKALASIQFGSEKMMARFDMTEYQDKTSFVRFIGSPDGATHGALTDAVREKPYSLVLLDEFEKAYPDILNLFLQVLDDGRLTDSMDRVVDFTNTIIIATSNAHSDIINEALSKGEGMGDIEEYLKKRLVDVFKPELLNRFTKIIIFKNLKPDDLRKIVEFNLQDVSDIVKEQGIALEFDQSAVVQIAKLGYDPAFGARPLRRVIDERVRAPLSEALLAKKVKKGDQVVLKYENEQFTFIPKQ